MRNLGDILIAVTKDSDDYELVRMNAKKLFYSSNPYVLCDFAEYVKLADTEEIMTIISNAMKRIGDIVHLYELLFLMSERGAKNFNFKEIEDLIKKSGNAKLMSYSLAFTDLSDEEDMLTHLYATKNAKWISALQEEVDVSKYKGFNEALDRAIDFDYFPPCFEHYPTRDISNLTELVIASENPYLMTELANYMEYLIKYRGASGLNVSEIVTAFFKASVNEPLHQYEFAASTGCIDKRPFTNSVIESGMAKYMYYMYEYVKGVDQELLVRSINNTGNEKYIKLTK